MTSKRARRTARGRNAAPQVEVLVGSPQWRRRRHAASLVRKAIRTAALIAGGARSTRRAGLAILLTDDSAIRALNRDWRKRNAATNVLSFPARSFSARSLRGRSPRHLGDIVIAYETVAREAVIEGKPFGHHLVHLAVHGYLHLLGHDHATEREADRMERLEIDILARLGVPDPYRGTLPV
jgi:probable rRNA maturation factor